MSPELLFSVATLIFSTALAACCVLACWKWASSSTPRRKSPASEPATPTSGQLATVLADQAELFSALEKLTTTVKRLSSRAGMQDHREKLSAEASAATAPPPPGTPKAELRRYYGLNGASHVEVARRAQQNLALE